VRDIVIWTLGATVALLAPYFVGSDPVTLGKLYFIAVLLMVGVGLNIAMGFAGEMFLGPTALVAVGAFGAASLAVRHGWAQSFPMMCLSSVIVAVLVALLIGVSTLRVAGFYFAMMTLFLALAVPTIAEHWSVMGGTVGLSLLTAPNFVQRPSGVALYEVGVAIVAALSAYSWLIKESRLGRQFAAIRSSDELARAVGIRPFRTKLVALLLAAIPCGLAGGFYVYSQEFITSDSITIQHSILILAGVVIGGTGTIAGPLIGVTIVGVASQFLGGLTVYQGLVYGGILVIVAMVLPEGVVNLWRSTRLGRRPDEASQRQRLVRREEAGVDVVQQLPAAAPLGTVGGLNSLVVNRVGRSFGGLRALDGVDLVVDTGSVHALVGPNGSGKTTLLNLITGYYRPDGGQISIAGQPVTRSVTTSEIVSMGVARTFQTPKLIVTERVIDNVLIGAELHADGSMLGAVLHTRRSRRAFEIARARSAYALSHLGIDEGVIGSEAGFIPHGTERLVEIARALALSPMFVLLDEPAAGLSASEAESLKKVVRAMAAQGYGVLIVEHNLPIVFDIADTVTVLDQGRVIAVGTPAEVSANPEVLRVYIGGEKRDAAAVGGMSAGDNGLRSYGEGQYGAPGMDVATRSATGDLAKELVVEGLQASYGSVQVVFDVGFTVRPGELVAVVGRNGAGKTTSLAAIAGLRYGMGGGSVRLDGTDVSSAKAHEIVAMGLSLVPERRRIFREMSVRDNLILGAFSRRRMSGLEDDLDRIWDLFPVLADFRFRQVGRLSGGQQQMVAIGQALMSRPRWLLLDEPASGVAPVLVEEIYSRLTQLLAAGLGLVVVDQSVERALSHSDRFLVMDLGRIVLSDRSTPGAIEEINQIILGGETGDKVDVPFRRN
jgi:branched-chain amino acid transport system ATP-binding protein